MGCSHEICGYTCEEGWINMKNRGESPWYRNWRHIECPLWYCSKVCQTRGTSSHNKLHIIILTRRGKSIVFFIRGIASRHMWTWRVRREVVRRGWLEDVVDGQCIVAGDGATGGTVGWLYVWVGVDSFGRKFAYHPCHCNVVNDSNFVVEACHQL